jgi:hypothetical protein
MRHSGCSLPRRATPHDERGTVAISRVRLPGVAALVLSLTFHSPCGAAETVHVGVIHAKDDEPSRRVRGELAAAGLEPIDVRSSPDATRSTAEVALSLDAVAVVRVVSDSEMELVIVDARTKTVLYQKVVRSAPGGDPLALRAVEDLRARLVKLKLVEPAPAEVPKSAPPAMNTPPPAEDRGIRTGEPPRASFWATGALGASLSAGGLGGDFVAHAGLRYDTTTRWAASLSALLPLASQTVTGVGAHAEVRVYAVDALAHYAPIDHGVFAVDVGAGGAVVIAAMQGFPETPALAGRSETLVSGAPLADVSASVRPTSMLRLRADLLGGVAIPRLAVTFEDQSVAVWGRPFVAAFVGAEIALVPGSNAGEPR